MPGGCVCCRRAVIRDSTGCAQQRACWQLVCSGELQSQAAPTAACWGRGVVWRRHTPGVTIHRSTRLQYRQIRCGRAGLGVQVQWDCRLGQCNLAAAICRWLAVLVSGVGHVQRLLHTSFDSEYCRVLNQMFLLLYSGADHLCMGVQVRVVQSIARYKVRRATPCNTVTAVCRGRHFIAAPTGWPTCHTRSMVQHSIRLVA